MKEALYEGKYFDLKIYLESKIDVKGEIEKLKKRADKGAFLCPYCNEILILKSGEIREEHFAHRHFKSCEVSIASEVYQKQVKRESKRHSVIKEIIFDELKSQEKINTDLQVDYGYITKAAEKWRFYPDIIINNKERELAITILTDVTSNNDEKLVKQIKNRNRYFKNKNLEPIWFIEDVEQSIDMNHRVIHLWEAELDIAIKTAEDLIWEETLNSLSLKHPLFELFNYHHLKLPSYFDIQSIYYVHSTETNIVFTIQRFIKDENKYPFRAFALNKPYQISLSTALWTAQELQLSDPKVEKQQREQFIEEVKKREVEYSKREKEEQQMSQRSIKSFKIKSPINDKENIQTQEFNSSQHRYKPNLSMQTLEKRDLPKVILAYIRKYDVISAAEISEYLVKNCGASSETFSTGRYKIYLDVCQFLESLTREGTLELVERDFVNDRVYNVVQSANG